MKAIPGNVSPANVGFRFSVLFSNNRGKTVELRLSQCFPSAFAAKAAMRETVKKLNELREDKE